MAVPTTPITLPAAFDTGEMRLTYETGGASPGLAPRRVVQIDGQAVSQLGSVYLPTVDPALNSVVGTPADPPYVGGGTGTLIAMSKAIADAVAGTLKVQIDPASGSHITVLPSTGTGALQIAVPIGAGGGSTLLVPAGDARVFLDISNIGEQPALLLIAGKPACLLDPGGDFTREGTFVPTDAMAATSENGTTLAVGYA